MAASFGMAFGMVRRWKPRKFHSFSRLMADCASRRCRAAGEGRFTIRFWQPPSSVLGRSSAGGDASGIRARSKFFRGRQEGGVPTCREPASQRPSCGKLGLGWKCHPHQPAMGPMGQPIGEKCRSDGRFEGTPSRCRKRDGHHNPRCARARACELEIGPA